MPPEKEILFLEALYPSRCRHVTKYCQEKIHICPECREKLSSDRGTLLSEMRQTCIRDRRILRGL